MSSSETTGRVQICDILGTASSSVSVSAVVVVCVDVVETLNRPTNPVLAAMARREGRVGWKWRSNTAYGKESLCLRVLFECWLLLADRHTMSQQQ